MKQWNRRCANHAMEERTAGELCYLSFPVYEKIDFIRHGFSTRQGGVSEGCLATMNFSFDRGDDPARVRENYRRMAGAIGVSPDSFVVARQTHTVNIRKVTAADRGCGVQRERPYQDIDGLMTDVSGITLVTFHADCLPVYFVDPKKRAIALVHAGWQGTVNGIVEHAVRSMETEYGCAAGDILVGIGPGICADCYEVGEEVAERFFALFPEAAEKPEAAAEKTEPEAAMKRTGTAERPEGTDGRKGIRGSSAAAEGKGILSSPHSGEDGRQHWQLDLKEANRRLLMRHGIAEEHIYVTDFCTRGNPERLFSHRAAGIRRGLNAAFLGITDEVV